MIKAVMILYLYFLYGQGTMIGYGFYHQGGLMDDALLNNINEADIEYTIVVKKTDDIVSDLTDDPTERLIYESIIDGIERSASEAIKNNKVAQLPSIGCIRKSPIRQAMRDNYSNFRIARTNMTGDQYKDHVREIIIDAKETQAKLDATKLIIKRTRSKNKKLYDKYYITIGKAYAEMFIQSILMLKEIPYNVEVQTHFDDLNGI